MGSFKKLSMSSACSISSLGISPLVASVLLIAVTMTIAGILAYWASSFVKSSLPELNATETECRFADFSIYSCMYVNSTKKINFILENTKNIELKSLKAFLIYANNSVSEEIPLNSTLSGGTLKSFSISNEDSSFSKMTVKTHCPELTVSKTCSRG